MKTGQAAQHPSNENR